MRCGIRIMFCFLILLSTTQLTPGFAFDGEKEWIEWCFTKKGAVTIIGTGLLVFGLPNFLWSFNCPDMAPENVAMIQKTGALIVLTERTLLGISIPIFLYLRDKKIKKHLESYNEENK